MKINNVSFVNFSKIYSGLRLNKLTIDFTQLTNNITLFIGKIGSGKSAIVSSLHVFPYNTATDINMENTDLILPDKSGMKQIELETSENIYLITHVYNRKKDGRIILNSSFKKNGVELNENTNVSSFKQIVLDELGIDETFLSLLSLNSSIKGFVQQSSTDRKILAGKLFSELSIFKEYYKKVSVYSQETESLLKDISKKMHKFNNTNKEELTNIINNSKLDIDKLKDDIRSILKQIGMLEEKKNEHSEIVKKYKDGQNKMSEILDEIEHIKHELSTKQYKSTDIQVIKNFINERETQLNNIKIDIASLDISIKSSLELLDAKKNNLETLENNNSKFDSNKLNELITLEAELKLEINRLNSKISNIDELKLDKNILINSNVYLDALQRKCLDLVITAGQYVNNIADIWNKYKKEKNNLVIYLENKLNNTELSISGFKLITSLKSTVKNIGNINYQCTKDCPYKQFYNIYINNISNTIEENNEKIEQMSEELSFVNSSLDIVRQLDSVYDFINENQKYFNLPNEIFNIETFITDFINTRSIFDVELLTLYIDRLECLEKKNEIIAKLEEINNKIEFYNKNSKFYEDVSNKIDILNNDIDSISKNISSNKHALNEKKTLLEKISNEITDNKLYLEKLMLLSDKRLEITTLKNDLGKYNDIINNIEEINEKLSLLYEKEKLINQQIIQLDIKYQDAITELNELNTLENQNAELVDNYSIIQSIRRAVSPTKGIPTEFIEEYIKNDMVDKINALLSTVYDGDTKLQLIKEDIICNEKEFMIPYIKDGNYVKDISYLSQGESAIMSLVFSLVLSENKLGSTDYNIFSMDEMDTNLDIDIRAKFIMIIEEYRRITNCEQMFLVSHNNMFDMYNVNVILTSSMRLPDRDNLIVKKIY